MKNNTSQSARAQVNETWRPTRGVRKPKCGKHKEAEYPYRDPRGRVVFTKIRFRHDPCYCGRGKDFAYKWRPRYLKPGANDIWQKPPDADCYLYRLDEAWPFIARGLPERIFWCEGEKDADTLRRGSHVVATSHHQGAGNATLAQGKYSEVV